MAALVNVTKIEAASSGTASASVTATAGNALIILSCEWNAAAPNLTVTGGGTWTTNAHTATDATTSYTLGFASCPSATGGTNTITVTWSAGSANTSFCYEFSGMATPILDAIGSTSNSAATTTTESLASQTNANASDVMLGGAFGTAATGWSGATNGWAIPTNGSEPSGTFITGWSAYKIVAASAAQTTTVTANLAESYYALIGAYQQAGGAPPQDTPELRLRSELQMRQLLAQ